MHKSAHEIHVLVSPKELVPPSQGTGLCLPVAWSFIHPSFKHPQALGLCSLPPLIFVCTSPKGYLQIREHTSKLSNPGERTDAAPLCKRDSPLTSLAMSSKYPDSKADPCNPSDPAKHSTIPVMGPFCCPGKEYCRFNESGLKIHLQHGHKGYTDHSRSQRTPRGRSIPVEERPD